MLGATRKRKSNGSVLIFDKEKVKELKKIYESESQDKAKDVAPDIDIEPNKKEKINTLDDESEGSEGSVSNEGYRVCGFIVEKIQE